VSSSSPEPSGGGPGQITAPSGNLTGHSIEVLLTICRDLNDFVNIVTPMKDKACAEAAATNDHSLAVFVGD
jgi:hypothetical protein